jgi:chemotaxis family two-component system response regulator Rcp1
MEILLVEDSLTAARLTIGALKKAPVPHRLTWLTDGQAASEFVFRLGRFVHAPRPDLILLDLTLPQKDGRDLLAEIKSDEDLRSIPVVVLTGSTDQDDIVQMQLLQVESYMTKPVDIDTFLKLIRDLARYWRADMILPTSFP